MTKRMRLALALALTAAVILGGGLLFAAHRSPSSSCSAPTREPLDPRSLQHLLPGAPPPVYNIEPPTSGPHQPGRLSGGVHDEPVPGVVQVGALESGQVLLQHHDLAPAERAQLEALAGPLVIVAPNPDLPTRVVATAWRTRQLCRAIDGHQLARFIADHAGHDPQGGG